MGWLSDIFGGGEQVQPVMIDDDNFRDEVLRSKVPVVLDVWSTSCAPCKRLEPVMFGLAKKYGGRVKVAELNVQRGLRTARNLGVRGTPTVLYFYGGAEVDRVVGFRGQEYHEEVIEENLLSRGGDAAEAKA